MVETFSTADPGLNRRLKYLPRRKLFADYLASKTVLLVVDHETKFATSSKVHGNVTILVSRFREHGMQIIFTMMDNMLDSRLRIERQSKEERLIVKPCGDAFIGTPLKRILTWMGATQLAICGGDIDVCIAKTAFGAANVNFKVTVVKEACFSKKRFAWDEFSKIVGGQRNIDVQSMNEFLKSAGLGAGPGSHQNMVQLSFSSNWLGRAIATLNPYYAVQQWREGRQAAMGG